MPTLKKLHLKASALATCLIPLLAHMAFAASECSRIDPSHASLIPNAEFNETLPPYGDVCVAAHFISSPVNDVILPGYHAPQYLAVSLYQNGKDIFDFTYPNAPAQLWPEAVDKILAISFPDLNHDGYRDVIILGHSLDAHGNDTPRPLVFLGSKTGFKLLQNLSTDLFFNGDMTIPDIIADINGQFGLNPPLPKDSD